MRVAIFHNFMDNIGGAERVGLTLARELGADIYSTVANQEAVSAMGFEKEVKKIGWIPANAPFRQQMALHRFRRLNLQGKYDHFIIDGDWAMSGAVKNKPNLWYVHSPIREIWDLYEYTREHSVPKVLRPVFDLWVKYNRYLNRKYARSVDKIVCNSKNTQERVRKFLGRDSVVIHPPIETSRFHYGKTGNYWLSVNRLITHKRVDLQMKAFAKMPEEKLVVIGCYEKSRHFRDYASYIRRIKPANVTLLKSVSFDDLVTLYANCKGFMTTSHNEDFGMAAVEAMASGKPVIAPNEGGFRESVIDGETGVLLDGIDEDKIVSAVEEIGRGPERYKEACIRRAEEFDTKIFIERITSYLNQNV